MKEKFTICNVSNDGCTFNKHIFANLTAAGAGRRSGRPAIHDSALHDSVNTFSVFILTIPHKTNLRRCRLYFENNLDIKMIDTYQYYILSIL